MTVIIECIKKKKIYFSPEFPTSSDNSPSQLADLKFELVNVSGINMGNVSWAINIDGKTHWVAFGLKNKFLENEG